MPSMARRRASKRRTVQQSVSYLILVIFVCLTLAPYLWAVGESFSPITDPSFLAQFDFTHLLGVGGRAKAPTLPHGSILDNYDLVFNFNYPPFNLKVDYLHSIIVAVGVTLATLLSSTLAGFVLAKYRFRGKETLFTLLIVTFMVPFSVIVIPLYITVVNLGLDNNLGALIVTGLWSPLGILMMRQFIESIPSELLEAGRIDGASEVWLVLRMIVPLSTSAIGVLAIYTFMHSWDDFLWPTVVLHNAGQWTLPQLVSFFGDNAFPAPFVMAVAVLTIVPVLIIYAFVARFFIRGIGTIVLNI